MISQSIPLPVILAAYASTSALAQKLARPPPAPVAFPSNDQTVYISGSFLTDPLVADALAYINSVVPPSLLNIRPSSQNEFGNVSYNADPAANCYWGMGSTCLRRTATANFKEDISTCQSPGQWGITWDDGPLLDTIPGGNPGTPQLRSALNTAGIKGTFFVAGTQVNKWPDEVKASYAAGHEIAVHTWTHRPCTNLTNAQLIAEIRYTERRIFEAIGKVPTMFRPPYGDMDDRVRAIVSALGYRIVVWTAPDFESGDTGATAAGTATYTTVVNKTQSWAQLPASAPGFISLQHDINNVTTSIAIATVDSIRAAKAANALNVKPMPAGQCAGIGAYTDSLNGTATTTTTPTGVMAGSGAGRAWGSDFSGWLRTGLVAVVVTLAFVAAT
ncbi:hypothetical protein BJ742DRAFT_782568 [Cladochytrium replicatum]|nr:hypothetical protein BJ742DRAFT_782568 [Cladochytrium replicatum]